MEKRAPRTNDIEPPTGPVLDIRADFLAQFGDGKESLNLGTLQVLDFNPCIVDDLFMIVHKVEEAAHIGTVTPRKGWCLLAVFASEVKRPSAPDRYSSLVGASPTGSKLSRATQPISGRGAGTR
jgi:hypothetical protein